METKDFLTQSGFTGTNNPSNDGYWPIAVDVGYSSVKGYAKNRIFSFPTFIRKTDTSNMVMEHLDKYDIQYRDEKGIEYDVGNRAIMISSDDDTYGTDKTLYGRDRYSTEIFKVCVRTALGIGLTDNKYGKYNGEDIIIQTGLPNDYGSDADKLRAAFSGHHVFDIRFGGRNDWVHFDFNIDISNVRIMAQPMGSFWCSIYDSVGNAIDGRKSLLEQNTCIFDGGFGTLDLFSIKKMSIEKSTTHEDCGMREVFSLTSNDIKDKYGVSIPVPYMQKYLETGKIKYMIPKTDGIPVDELDPSTFEMTEKDFTEILKSNSDKIARRAMGYLNQETQRLKDYDSLIITGGTGVAWANYISSLVESWGKNVIVASSNERIDAIFNNVRGYYMALHKYLLKQRKAGK